MIFVAILRTGSAGSVRLGATGETLLLERQVTCSDPSTDRRYQVSASLEYKLIRRRKILSAGRGMTFSISSSEIVFKPDDPIPAGLKIEASVEWPARLDNRIALRLHVEGETVKTESEYAIIKILRYEFRTARAR
jgi:hypothetical protein